MSAKFSTTPDDQELVIPQANGCVVRWPAAKPGQRRELLADGSVRYTDLSAPPARKTMSVIKPVAISSAQLASTNKTAMLLSAVADNPTAADLPPPVKHPRDRTEAESNHRTGLQMIELAKIESDPIQAAKLRDRARELLGGKSLFRHLAKEDRKVALAADAKNPAPIPAYMTGGRVLSKVELAEAAKEQEVKRAALSAAAERSAKLARKPDSGAAAAIFGCRVRADGSWVHPSDEAREQCAERAKLAELEEAARKRAPAADPDAESAHRVVILKSFSKRTA